MSRMPKDGVLAPLDTPDDNGRHVAADDIAMTSSSLALPGAALEAGAVTDSNCVERHLEPLDAPLLEAPAAEGAAAEAPPAGSLDDVPDAATAEAAATDEAYSEAGVATDPPP